MSRLLSALLITLTLASHAVGADIQHRFLCCYYSGDKVCIVSAEGKI